MAHLAKLWAWPSQVLEDLESAGCKEAFVANCKRLVVTTSYSGIGAAEMAMRLLAKTVGGALYFSGG